MTWLNQGAVVIAPKTINDIGSVAQHMLFVSDCPANPPIINIIGN
jgi:hypothetical protein